MHDQHASACEQDPSAPAHMSFETQKTSGGHISLKSCPNWEFEVFFGIYRKCRCQKYIKCSIWISFDRDMTFQSFLTFWSRLRVTRSCLCTIRFHLRAIRSRPCTICSRLYAICSRLSGTRSRLRTIPCVCMQTARARPVCVRLRLRATTSAHDILSMRQRVNVVDNQACSS